MGKLFKWAVAAAIIVGSSAASAHDFFLLPDQFQAPRAGVVRISATVGSSFPTPEAVVATDRVERLHVHGAGKPAVRVVGPAAKALTLEVTGARPGLLVVGVSTRPRDVDYAEDRIPLILGEYRFAPAAATAVERLQRPRTWLVSSRRFAKSFICVQTCGNGATARKPLGAVLEFVSSGSSDSHYRLLRDQQPLTNYPVDLVGADGKRQHFSTDARGEVHLPDGARGTMMLFAAYLVPPTASERFILDLTSLTFRRN